MDGHDHHHLMDDKDARPSLINDGWSEQNRELDAETETRLQSSSIIPDQFHGNTFSLRTLHINALCAHLQRHFM